MTTTAMLYATSAAGSGLHEQPSAWHNEANATGAPNGSWATNDNRWSPGYQRLVLGGYNPQAAILAATGGRVPYSIDYLHVGVTFQLDAASNYSQIDVLLLDSGGQPIATQRLYLWDATTGVTVVGWVNFTGHNGYDAEEKLLWGDLAGCQVAIELTRSGAAGTDTFRVDAVGMFAAYTLDQPTQPTPPPAPIQVQPPGGGVSLRVYDRDGNRLAILPWMTLTRAVVRNDLGTLATSVPKALIPDGVMDGERYLRVAVNGVEMPEWYVLDDDGDDDADEGGTMRPVAISGTGAGEILDWGIVYSWQYHLVDQTALNHAVQQAQKQVNSDQKALLDANNQLHLAKDKLTKAQKAKASQVTLDALQKQIDAAEAAVGAATDKLNTDKIAETYAADTVVAGAQGVVLGLQPWQEFAGKTPGFIIASLIAQAQARGCFPQLNYSFTADVDSAGVGWPKLYSHKYDIGTSILKVLTTMSDDGWIDWKMTGFTLDLYAADTALAADHPEVVLRLGKGVTQAPRKRTRKTARSAILANGDQGATIEVSDADALATWGRREGYEGRSGVTDYGTLTAATQVSLSRQTTASESFTLELDPYALPEETPALPQPGGYIRYDRRRLSPTQLEPLRVQSIAYDYGDPPKVSVELMDMWLDADVKRARQIDTILNGSSANQRVPIPPTAPDTLAPAAVAALSLQSTAYLDPIGQLFAQMTASWTEVTRNVDNSPISDLAGYEIEWRQLGVQPGSTTISLPPRTLWQWSPVVANANTDVRIRAVDRFGNPSAWTDWVTIVSGNDVTPPAVTSPPLVDNYLGLLRTRWDGGFVGGAPRAPDLDRVEVHLSTIGPGFTPDVRAIEDGGTLAGSMFAPGSVFRDTPIYGQIWWARLVAVDTTGNRSAPSDAASGTTGQVVSADVFDGAIGTAKLADLAVKTAKIDDLAVNTAKVGSIEVGKLVAGTLTAQIIMGGTISTNANPNTTGGVQINSLGIYAWNPSGVQTVAIDTSGNATLTGIYQTATSGRRIQIGAAGAIGEIDFISPTGAKGYVRSYTESGGLEAIQLGIGDPTAGYFLENRVNINSTGYFTYRGKTHEWVFDSSWFIFDRRYSAARIETGGTGDGRITFRPGSGGSGYLTLFDDGGYPSSSARIQFATHDNYGGMLKVSHTTTTQFEMKDINDSTYLNCWGVTFINQSDAASKTGIRTVPAEESHLAGVRATAVRKYRRKTPAQLRVDGAHLEAHEEEEGVEQIGLIAQEAPAQIVHPGRASDGSMGIDQYQMTTYLWRAVQELADKVDSMTEGSKK